MSSLKDKDKIVETPGERNKNTICKRLSYSPAVAIQSATPSSRSKRAHHRKLQRIKAKHVEAILQDVEFNMPQKVAKEDSKKMRLNQIPRARRV